MKVFMFFTKHVSTWQAKLLADLFPSLVGFVFISMSILMFESTGVVSRSVSPSRCVSPSPRPRPKLPEGRRKRAYTKSSPTSCCARTTEALWREPRFKTDFF